MNNNDEILRNKTQRFYEGAKIRDFSKEYCQEALVDVANKHFKEFSAIFVGNFCDFLENDNRKDEANAIRKYVREHESNQKQGLNTSENRGYTTGRNI